MAKEEPEGRLSATASRGEFHAVRVGRLASPASSGELLVECEGAICAARSLSLVSRSELTKAENRGREVLLLYESGDSSLPIIVGFLDNPIESLVSMEDAAGSSGRRMEVLLDGKRITIEAEEEVVLKCGSGSITLRKDGKIIIRGTHLLSRSSGPHRIKGGSVNIN